MNLKIYLFRAKISVVALLGILCCFGTTAWALTPHETFVYNGSPTAATIAEWFSSEERARLQASPFQVEWIHSAN